MLLQTHIPLLLHTKYHPDMSETSQEMLMNQFVGSFSSHLVMQKSREGCILIGRLPTYTLMLSFNISSNTHPIAAAHKISSRHVVNMTMNTYESVG